MDAEPDLFPGFESRTLDTRGARIFLRHAGRGPPLVLLHGFPQTHVCWHRLAGALADHFTVIVPDLRGYGWSSVPASDPAHRVYSKRAMGEDVVDVLDALGFTRARFVGHDRGGRVAYRLALDHPGRVERLALLDIVPTVAMWRGMDAALAVRTYHWSFLAQAAPMPETLLTGAPVAWLDHTLASWTAAGSLAPFDRAALARYRAFFQSPDRIHALCEDYRAGATCDLQDDEADLAAGRTIVCPTLVLWGDAGIPAGGRDLLDSWRTLAPNVTGRALRGGHFLPEEAPAETLSALRDFL